MRLVEAENNYYINMDLVTRVWYDGVEYHASFVNTTKNSIISESAYNTILLYGKAKI